MDSTGRGGVVTTQSLAVELQAGGLTQEHVEYVSGSTCGIHEWEHVEYMSGSMWNTRVGACGIHEWEHMWNT